MIGRTKLSTIREKLRQAFAATDYNPLVELDQEIRKLKMSKSTSTKGLETFRAALAQVVEEPKKPARSKRVRTTKKAV